MKDIEIKSLIANNPLAVEVDPYARLMLSNYEWLKEENMCFLSYNQRLLCR